MKIKLLIITSLCILLILTGCSGVSSKQKNIYTNNEHIAEIGDTYTYRNRIGSKNLIGDNNQIDLEFGKFYGTETLWSIDSKGKYKVDFNYRCEISEGKFKTVLITPKGQVLDLFEGSDDGKIQIDLDKGKYRLKIVGNEAKGKIQIDVSLQNS